MVNKVILIGRLGGDPEVRYTQDGLMVVSFQLGVSDRYKSKNGEKQEKTTWVRIVAWRKLAEFIANYVAKGRLCYVEGKLNIRSYDGKDGEKKYATEVVATVLNPLDKAKTNGDNQGSRGAEEYHYQDDPDSEVPF